MVPSLLRHGAAMVGLLDCLMDASRKRSMRAVCIETIDGKPELVMRDLPRPEPGPEELLIHVRSAGVNFADLYRAAKHFGTSVDAATAIAGLEMAGEVVGLQMGLNFAGFFDPVTASQTTATSRFFGAVVGWLFIVINGHLLVIAALVDSFKAFPVGGAPFAFLSQALPHQWGATIFATGLWIALPMVAMLSFVNLVLGVISRVAAQINVFAIGFPITLGVGLLGILMTLPLLQQPFTMALERMLAYF